jgi:hypothetical protein
MGGEAVPARPPLWAGHERAFADASDAAAVTKARIS